jgi:glutamine synthetase
MHKGIVEKLDPGPAIEGNGYAQGGANIPTDWLAALRLLQGSAFMKDCLGERFLAIYHAIKTAECRRFNSQVSELDLDWYLNRA